jgi:hypothetical protein
MCTAFRDCATGDAGAELNGIDYLVVDTFNNVIIKLQVARFRR